MNARRGIDLIIAVVFLVFVINYVYTHFYTQSSSPNRENQPLIKAADLLARKAHIPPTAVNMTATSSACTFFLKSSAEKSMKDFAHEFIAHHSDEIIKTCQGAIPESLQSKLNAVILKCADSRTDAISAECYSALLEAKTKSVATIISHETSVADLDAVILLHLIADAFSSGDFLEHPERNLDLIDALLQKEPQFYNGYKLKLMLLSMSSLFKKELYREMFYSTLDRAKEINNSDRDLREIELSARGNVFENNSDGRKELVEFIEFLDEQSLKQPNEWVYDYYKAHALYRNGKGNYQQVLSILENALKKSPNEKRLKTTIENLQSDDENLKKRPFSLSIEFSLSNL